MPEKTDLCLQVYDYLLTFEREVALVWFTKWNITKLLFFIARYTAFADVIMVFYRALIGLYKGVKHH